MKVSFSFEAGPVQIVKGPEQNPKIPSPMEALFVFRVFFQIEK